MSEINLGKALKSLEVGRKLDAYTGVIIHAGKNANGEDITYSVGNNSGYVLETNCIFGNQIMANAILASLKLRNVRYQPFEANGALIDPAFEIGDEIVANGTQSFVLAAKMQYDGLMAADISAPYDEEADHEFKYEPRQVREFKRESTYTRSRLSITQDAISAEVVRATGAETSLSGRLTVEADRITSSVAQEVTRATGAERLLGTRIEQRLDSITLSVTSADGSSVFTLKDGSTTLDTQTLDLSVKAVNVSGTLTASQIAAGAISIGKLDSDAKSKLVTSSQTRAQYYLSTSDSSATGGSWSDTMPTWASGKYIWTREKTTDTYADNSTSNKYSPSENGRYDKNLTNALSSASGAQTSASGALARSRIIYFSSAGGSLPSVPTEWVNDSTGGQNKWTLVRPEYSKDYPALYTATQRETVGGTFSCTTPRLDATTTVIDGAHIITGTIDATKIAVSDLSALNATIGGWSIGSEYLKREVENSCRVYLRAQPASSISTNSYAIQVQKYDTENAQFTNYFTVTYGGKVTCTDIKITGGEMTGGKVGGASIGSHSFGGISIPTSGINTGQLIIPSGHYEEGSISTAAVALGAITGAKIGDKEIATGKLVDAINTSLGYADTANSVFSGAQQCAYLSCSNNITAYGNLILAANCGFSWAGHSISRGSIVDKDGETQYVLKWS